MTVDDLIKEFEGKAKTARSASAKLTYKHQHVKTQYNIEASIYEVCARRLREVLSGQ